MSDEPPEAARTLPVKAELRFGHRISEKCVVTALRGGWLCAHGTDGEDRLKAPLGEKADGVTAAGSIGIDPAQARVYFHSGHPGEDPKVLMVTPDDTPFRSSAKGRRDDHSISYDEMGKPVVQVRLLYALKTKRYNDRLAALDLLPLDFLGAEVATTGGHEGPTITFGQIFDLMHKASLFSTRFTRLVGQYIADDAARRSGALSDWKQWESVAEGAAEITRIRSERNRDDERPDNDAKFLQTIAKTFHDHNGLAAQYHAKRAFELCGGIGRWRDLRSKFGFDWMPSLHEWGKSWPPDLQ